MTGILSSALEYNKMTAKVYTPTCLFEGIKAILFDLDGTIYLCNQLVDGVVNVLNGLADHVSLRTQVLPHASSGLSIKIRLPWPF